ncbi:quinol monooxygenase YgiN [Inquilinus ginsengisoli]|uniref:Quinol monooxygenase YgiN n=2 Tax=Rhodospirillaceae TaxID=41295 RepID=A0ABU1JKP7_9PROT|nr:quinol monooxygenase YgiN [Inquilinus ginsengisoli]
MQRLTLVRYTTRPEHAAENEALARAVFAELRAVRPDGIAYLLFRDGDEWMHLFVNTRADDAAALTELPSFKAYGRDVSARCVAPPEPQRLGLQLLESYGLISD